VSWEYLLKGFTIERTEGRERYKGEWKGASVWLILS